MKKLITIILLLGFYGCNDTKNDGSLIAPVNNYSGNYVLEFFEPLAGRATISINSNGSLANGIICKDTNNASFRFDLFGNLHEDIITADIKYLFNGIYYDAGTLNGIFGDTARGVYSIGIDTVYFAGEWEAIRY